MNRLVFMLALIAQSASAQIDGTFPLLAPNEFKAMVQRQNSTLLEKDPFETSAQYSARIAQAATRFSVDLPLELIKTSSVAGNYSYDADSQTVTMSPRGPTVSLWKWTNNGKQISEYVPYLCVHRESQKPST